MFKTTQLKLKFVLFPKGVKEGPGGGWSLGIYYVVQTGDGPLFRFYTLENDSLNLTSVYNCGIIT